MKSQHKQSHKTHLRVGGKILCKRRVKYAVAPESVSSARDICKRCLQEYGRRALE